MVQHAGAFNYNDGRDLHGVAQVDNKGRRQMMLDEIVDHRILESGIPKSKGTYETQRGLTRNVRTTRGWEICVQWKN
eukprot:scaffold191900_cov27-Attheya_sp.AAC.1